MKGKAKISAVMITNTNVDGEVSITWLLFKKRKERYTKHDTHSETKCVILVIKDFFELIHFNTPILPARRQVVG